MTLSKEQILGADDKETRVVKVPEWGGEVIVRALTSTERDSYESLFVDAEDDPTSLHNVRAELVARTVVDEDGERLFTDAEAAELAQKNAKATNRIFEVARELSGITEEAVEELAGN